MKPSLAIYTDGGVAKVNPSPIGGAWAICLVDTDDDAVIEQHSGTLLPKLLNLPAVSNNNVELITKRRQTMIPFESPTHYPSYRRCVRCKADKHLAQFPPEQRREINPVCLSCQQAENRKTICFIRTTLQDQIERANRFYARAVEYAKKKGNNPRA